MAEKEVDLTFVGMGARVENLDSVEKVVVVEMEMIVVGFDLEVVELVGFEKMECYTVICHHWSPSLLPLLSHIGGHIYFPVTSDTT